MDDDYYRFTIEHSVTMEGIHIANVESLICLKCKAFLDMATRKGKGEQVDSKHIAKHKKDVFRLVTMLAPSDSFDVPQTLKVDVRCFYEAVKSDLPNKDFFEAAGLHNIMAESVLEQLEKSFL